jgi:N-acetylgalactosamine-6-sulfatase
MSTGKKQPNIVVILPDDIGWGDLGCYGNPDIDTPNLDRLGRQGLRFTSFYAASTVCSPARACVLTGIYPARLGIHRYLRDAQTERDQQMTPWLDDTIPNLPRLLQQAGYSTGHFGKWHLGEGEGAPEPAAYGYDEYRISHQGNGPTWEWDPNDPNVTARTVDASIDFVHRHSDEPFFVNVWMRDMHAVLQPTEEQMAPYSHWKYGMSEQHAGAKRIWYSAMANMDHHLLPRSGPR